MLLIIAIMFLYMVELFFEAKWDAELLKPRQSNHFFKSGLLVSWLSIGGLFFIIGHFANYYLWWLSLILLGMCYPFIRFVFFDDLLNNFRGKPGGYKTAPNWMKWVSILIVISLLTIIYFAL